MPSDRHAFGLFLRGVQVAIRGDEDVAAVRQRLRGPAALARAGDWLAVHPELAVQDIGRLESLAADFPQGALRAVAVMLHDSDFLWMSLAEKGRATDRFSDSPHDPARGNAARWGEARLRQVWNSKPPFAQEKLARAAELLGIPKQPAKAGLEDPPPGAEGCDVPAAAAAGISIETAPALAPPPNPMVGEQFGLQVMFRNASAGFTGIRVEAGGPALALTALRQCQIFVAATSIRMARAHPLAAAAPEDGVFHFPGWEAPATANLGITLLCEARQAGTADLTVRVRSEGGAFAEQTTRVEVAAACRLPLQFEAGPNACLSARQMQSPRVLSGVAILRAGKAAELLP